MSCSQFQQLPTIANVLSFANENKSSNKKIASTFSLFYACITKLYGDLKIPILTRNAIRNIYLSLLDARKKSLKKYSQSQNFEVQALFHVTKCKCFAETLENECKCVIENRVPLLIFDFYMDQLGARKYTIDCDCDNGHVISLRNGDEYLSLTRSVSIF